MRASAAARRYAKALFALAQEDRRVSEIRGELTQMVSLIEGSGDLREALLTPLHPVAERKAVVAALEEREGLSPLLRNFFAYLIDRRRLVDFDEIAGEFERLADEASGLLTAQVISATELDDRRKDRLRRALSERTGREVRLDIQVDSDLIGGAIAKVGDLVFDGSLRTQLRQLRTNLTKGS